MADPTPLRVPEALDWKEVLEFVQKQQKADRDHIQFMIVIVGIAVAVLGFFGFRSLKSDVESMVMAQFKDDQIKATMRTAADASAAGMVKDALSRMVSEEVTKQRPLIASTLQAEVGMAIKDLQSSVNAAQKQVSGMANAIKDRRLSRAQKDQLAAALKHHKDFTVVVETSVVDVEGKQFGSDLVEAFSLAEWKSRLAAAPAMFVTGIVGSMPESSFTDSACKAAMGDISKAFAAFGYQIQWNPEPGPITPSRSVMIRIGQRVFTPSSGAIVGIIGAIQ